MKDTLKRDAEDNPRRKAILEAGLVTFMRYGFRKTSMDEVAAAADISRQGLYLHFPTKERLFCAAIRHALDQGLELARVSLSRKVSLEERLLGAFDAWFGRHMEAGGNNFVELKETSERLLRPDLAKREHSYIAMLTEVIDASGSSAAHKAAGVDARAIASTLVSIAVGLQSDCRSRDEFLGRMTVGIRAIFATSKGALRRR